MEVPEMTGQQKTRHPVFDQQLTEAVCNVVAQTEYPGLSGSELESVLQAVRVDVFEEGPNKRTRLFRTLHNTQVRQKAGNVLVAFINAAMNPARYTSDPGRFDLLQAQLNPVLVLYGFRLNDSGQFSRGQHATTLTEAARLTGELFAELRRRNCHAALFTYCDEELVRKSLFHAISEAAKSIPERLRRHAGLGTDGENLYTAVFSARTGTPLVCINDYRSDSQRSEQHGFKNLLTGIHGHYRNPRAHTTRLGSAESREDFFDAFSLFSYVHRRLDQAGVQP